MAKTPHTNEATKYARDVVKGKIPACLFVRQACQRQLDDLKRWPGKTGPFYFDKEAAERFVRFAEFCPHVKGEWARRRETLRYEPWQKFMWVCVFGWKRTKDHTRRFREAYMEIPRKNGKSCQVAPAGLFMLVEDGEAGAEVYCGATTEKQAWEVFGPARLMAKKGEEFCESYGAEVNARSVVVHSEAAKFEPLIGDPGDGASPSCAIVDEYHEHKDDRLFNTMLTGMGARRQPLMLAITTAGYNLGGPCYAMRDRARKVLGCIIEDEELFAIIYTIDKDTDWTTKEALVMANPNYGVSVMEDYLLAQQRKAMQNPNKQNAFKTKHLNVWCNASSAWMNMLKWDAVADTSLQIEDFAGEKAVVALDLASKIDIAAKVTVFTREIDGDAHYYAFGKYYLPEETVQESGNEQYQGWAHEERLTLTPGNVIDFAYIEDDLKEDASRFEVVEVPYDPFQATQLSTRMLEEGFPMVEMRPTTLNFSEPMKELESLVLSKRLHHNGCPILTWMVSNVVAHLDNKDNIYPRKERPENKIDGVVALIMALGRALVPQAEEVSFWEKQ